jgi:hypothetical protein
MEASVDPQCRGPDWMPITPKTGSLFHAETQLYGLSGILLSQNGSLSAGFMTCSPVPRQDVCVMSHCVTLIDTV